MKKIAFTGIRGIPASYSGFETFVEELSKRLVNNNFKVCVYNRSTHYKNKLSTFNGAKLIYLPTIPTKHLDTIIHTFISLVHAAFKKFDLIYICGVGNSPLCFIPKLYNCKVIINVDGKDWERKKWGSFAKKYLKLAEKLATKFANIVITDSLSMQNYYKAEYNADTICIPYGGDIEPDYNTDILEHYELIPQNYLLFVGRLEPENNAHILIEAFKQIPDKRGFKLVIVGDAPYASSYKDYLRKLSSDDKTITFTGYLFGDGYRQLSTHAYLFILPSEVGGTHPVLTQQMFIGNCIVAAKTDSNTEVLNNCGFLFDLDEPVVNLKNIILYLIQNPNVVNEYKKRAKEYARGFYSWDRIAKQYIELFQNEFGE
jgi:glycosyltransferase involved in cell wall biosynthesis